MTITLFDPDKNNKEWGDQPRRPALRARGRRNEQGSFNGGLLLDDGKIMVQFVSKFTEFEANGATGAVSGGTGAYKDARGDVTLLEDFEACDMKGTLATIQFGGSGSLKRAASLRVRRSGKTSSSPRSATRVEIRARALFKVAPFRNLRVGWTHFTEPIGLQPLLRGVGYQRHNAWGPGGSSGGRIKSRAL